MPTIRLATLIAVLFTILTGLTSRAQTPIASPTAIDADAVCGTISGPSVDSTPSPSGLNPSVVTIDQAYIDAMLPTLQTTQTMAAVIAERTRHPPMTDLTSVMIETQSDWSLQLAAIRTTRFGDTPPLSDTDIAAVVDYTASQSPGMGSGGGSISALTAPSLTLALSSLCAETDNPDLIFIDQLTRIYSDTLVLTDLEIAYGTQSDLVTLAGVIQEEILAELDQLNLWRQTWYGGSPVPIDDAG